MTADRLTYARELGGLDAFGLETPELLFEPSARLSPRLRVLDERPGRTRFAFPLPGTPDARGAFTERPRSLGTGWVWLTVFTDPPWTELLRSRFSSPRSASLAEREWNLLCRLRAQGIGTPEPLVVGARGTGVVARRSFLLVRELEGALQLPRWLHPRGLGGEGAERERGLQALGLFLGTLRRSDVWLPGLALDDLWITPAGIECDPGDHGESSVPPKNRMPGVSLSEVAGGCVVSRGGRNGDEDGRGRLTSLLDALAESLTADERERLTSLAGPDRAGVSAAR